MISVRLLNKNQRRKPKRKICSPPNPFQALVEKSLLRSSSALRTPPATPATPVTLALAAAKRVAAIVAPAARSSRRFTAPSTHCAIRFAISRRARTHRMVASVPSRERSKITGRSSISFRKKLTSFVRSLSQLLRVV